MHTPHSTHIHTHTHTLSADSPALGLSPAGMGPTLSDVVGRGWRLRPSFSSLPPQSLSAPSSGSGAARAADHVPPLHGSTPVLRRAFAGTPRHERLVWFSLLLAFSFKLHGSCPGKKNAVRLGARPSLQVLWKESRSWRNAVISADRGKSQAQGPGSWGLQEWGALPSGPHAAPLGQSGHISSLPSALPFPSQVPVGWGAAEPAPCSSQFTGLWVSALAWQEHSGCPWHPSPLPHDLITA